MRITQLLTAVVLLCIAAASCNKQDNNLPGVNDYTQLKPGNYWIYQHYMIDTNGVAQPGSQWQPGAIIVDSTYVEKDTVINRHVYHKVVTAGTYEVDFLRDSLNYLVSLYPLRVFAANAPGTTLFSAYRPAAVVSMDSVYRAELKMSDREEVISVPAGTFTTMASILTYTFYPFAMQQAPVTPSRSTVTRYAKGVGKVSEMLPFYISDPNTEERRLVRYHVQH